MATERLTHAHLKRHNRVYAQQVDDIIEAAMLELCGINAQDLADAWGGVERGIDLEKVRRVPGANLPRATHAAWEEKRSHSPVKDLGYQEAVNRISNAHDVEWLLDVVKTDHRKTVCGRASDRMFELRSGGEEEPPAAPPPPEEPDEGADEEE